MKEGKVVSERTGFGSVIFKQGKSRHLSRFGKHPENGGTGEDPFNGCAWIDVHDFYKAGQSILRSTRPV